MATERICHSNDRDTWLEARDKLITASDVPVVLGLSKFSSPLQLHMRKRGLAPAVQDNERMEWGRRLESVIIRAYHERTGRPAEESGWLLVNPESPWLGATLDASTTVDGSANAPLEIKTTGLSNADEWEEGIPPYYLPQIQTQMYVTGAHAASCACLIGGQRMVWADVERDDSMIETIVQKTMGFWDDVQHERPPEPQGHSEDEAALRALYPQEIPGRVIALPGDSVEWSDRLRELEAEIKVYEQERRLLRQRIEAAIGDAEEGHLPGGGGFRWKTVRRKGYEVQPSESRQLRRFK